MLYVSDLYRTTLHTMHGCNPIIRYLFTIKGDYLPILMYLIPCKVSYFGVYKRMIFLKVFFTIKNRFIRYLQYASTTRRSFSKVHQVPTSAPNAHA